VVRRMPEKRERRERPRAPYPSAEEFHTVLKDGTRLHVRPLRAEDAPRLLELYHKLSHESLYFRFFAVPQFDPEKAAYLADMDYVDQFALLAEDETGIVATARFHRDAARPDHAEVAFTVADAMQGKGIGSLLFHRLVQIARGRGVAFFDAEVLRGNEKMIRVFEASGLSTTKTAEGDKLRISIALGTPPA
jgi:GNAT superfamily N-acetyltransferase